MGQHSLYKRAFGRRMMLFLRKKLMGSGIYACSKISSLVARRIKRHAGSFHVYALGHHLVFFSENKDSEKFKGESGFITVRKCDFFLHWSGSNKKKNAILKNLNCVERVKGAFSNNIGTGGSFFIQIV
jgi:hypothetical protein